MTEEMIDVLDEKGEQTGRTATRTEVHTEGLWHRIAVVAVLDDKYQDMEIIDKQFFDCFVLKVSEKDAQCIILQTSEVQAARFFGMEEFRKMLADGIMVNRKPVYDAILDIMENH